MSAADGIDPARGTQRLLVLRHTTEGRARAALGLGGIEPFVADEALGFHLQVEADLFVGARFGGAQRDDETQARAKCVEATHVLRNTASRPAEKRRQLSSSSPSARRPAAVIL